MDLPSRASDAGPEQGEPKGADDYLYDAEDAASIARRRISIGDIVGARFHIDYAISQLERAKELLK